jgi:hypothetical protein
MFGDDAVKRAGCLREDIALCSERNVFEQHVLEDSFANRTADMFTP